MSDSPPPLPPVPPETLWEWFQRERLAPLLLLVVLVEIASACVIVVGRPLLGHLYQEILLFGMQFAALSCLGLWMALEAQSWQFRLPVAVAIVAAALLVLASYGNLPSVAELATMFVGHTVVVWLLAFLLSVPGVVRGLNAAHGAAPLRRYNLRQIFMWTTLTAALAFATRFARLPRAMDVIFIIGSCPLLALAVAVFVTHVRSVFLHAALSFMAAFALAVALTGVTRRQQLGELWTFLAVQAVVLLLWSRLDRAWRALIAYDVVPRR